MATLSSPLPTTSLTPSLRRRQAPFRLHLPRASFSVHPNPEGGEVDRISPSPFPSRAAVFVAAPLDPLNSAGQLARRKLLGASFLALSTGGVDGVTIELWWGLVEAQGPGLYNWDGYAELVALAQRSRLKVRVVAAFHQRGSGPGDPCWLPLPRWVLEEMEKDPDLAYTDRFGRRNKEYISLGCDAIPVLNDRTPIQAYSDFLTSFRDNFREYLGETIMEIQIGMGPSGELRYPSCPSERPWNSNVPALGEFQCYDKFMIASLDACAQEVEKREWGSGGPLGTWSLSHNLEDTWFFRSNGSWNTSYGQFFLAWYSDMLLRHGESLCMTASTIFQGTGVKLLGKIAGIHWHYRTSSHPSELTAGYYNVTNRDGYVPIAQMFAKYGMSLCSSCFDFSDSEEGMNPNSSPEGFLRQLMHAARICSIPLSGENSRIRTDEASLNQIIRNVKIHTDGFGGSFLSFNFVRMNKNLFELQSWQRFTRFVRQISEIRTIQAKLDLGGSDSCAFSTSVAEEVNRARTYL